VKKEDKERIMTAVGKLREFAEDAGRLKALSTQADCKAAQQIDTIALILERDDGGDHADA